MPLKGGLFASVLVLHVIKRWPHNFFYYFPCLRKMTCRFCHYCSCCQSATYCFCYYHSCYEKGTPAVLVGSIHLIRGHFRRLRWQHPCRKKASSTASIGHTHVMKRHHRRFCYHPSCHERHSRASVALYILVIKGLRHHPLYQHRALSILAFSFILSLH